MSPSHFQWGKTPHFIEQISARRAPLCDPRRLTKWQVVWRRGTWTFMAAVHPVLPSWGSGFLGTGWPCGHSKHCPLSTCSPSKITRSVPAWDFTNKLPRLSFGYSDSADVTWERVMSFFSSILFWKSWNIRNWKNLEWTFPYHHLDSARKIG